MSYDVRYTSASFEQQIVPFFCTPPNTLTGRVMYLIQLTRYDIMYTVNQILRAKSNPFKAHMAAKHLIRYLAGTTYFSITNGVRGRELWKQSRQRQINVMSSLLLECI